MGWSLDFCLTCDRQTTGGAYCSQACRLADLEKASPRSEPVISRQPGRLLETWSPSLSSSISAPPPPLDRFSPLKSRSSSSPSSSSLPPSVFDLPPPINFTAYRRARPTEEAINHPRPADVRSTSSTTIMTTPSTRPALTSSSSQTSLVSLQSSMTSIDDDRRLSDAVRTELRAYASCFDRIRDWKHRWTS